MDSPITKRLHISGLTPALSPADLSQRLSTFGTVKAVDGFGLQDGVGLPRKFGYVTIETTNGKLARCLNLLSGSTWKGAKLRIGEAKPDFMERLEREHQAASEEPPTKRRKKYGGTLAADMSLITPENVEGRGGWNVTPLGRMLRPVRMRPERPLPVVVEDSDKKRKAKDAGRKKDGEERKKKKKREKDPDSRARRRTIDMRRWGSVHLKGMFLDLETSGIKRPAEDVGEVDNLGMATESSESGSEVGGDDGGDEGDAPMENREQHEIIVEIANEQPPKSIMPPIMNLPDDNTNIVAEKNQSLNLLASLFGDKDEADWGGRESVGSDIDEDELTKGDTFMRGEVDDGFEIVPMDTSAGSQNIHAVEEATEDITMEAEAEAPPPPTQKQKQATKLKDLFAPREADAGFSLLGHLDLDLELDDEAVLASSSEPQAQHIVPEPSYNQSFTPALIPATSQPLQLNSKQALFFPLPQTSSSSNKARPKDLFDIAKENRWNWRDPAVGFYRTGTEDEIRKKWDEEKVELTREWKRRWREAGKVSRRRRGGEAEGE